MLKNDKDQALVAVITRTKDRPLLLERAVKSVHSQSFGDFIHVIINDGGSAKVVEKVLKKQAKLFKKPPIVIHNQKSIGMDPAANKAIKTVNSTYIAIHDDDDSWHPDFLKTTTQYLSGTNKVAVWAATDVITEQLSGDKLTKTGQYRWLPEAREINLYELCSYNYAPPISLLYKRSVLEELNYYDESLPAAADWDLAIRLLSKYDVDFIGSDHALAYYHLRPEAKGNQGNSVIAGVNTQAYAINMLMNRYLRQELAEGRLGIGYIMSKLKLENKKREESINQLNSRMSELEAAVDTKIIQLDKTLKDRTSIVNVLKRVKHTKDL